MIKILFSYAKMKMYVVVLFVTIFLFMLFSYTFQNISNAVNIKNEAKTVNENTEENKVVEIDEKILIVEYIEQEENVEEEKITEEEIIVMWQLEIPKIGLIAPIANGTTSEVMDEYIGHFEGMSKWNGNIGLAAHNRGYPVNYFKDIKELQIGDEIIYLYNNMSRIYVVNKVEIVEETDWTYLENTKDNRITLITCVEDKPNLRRVIQGSEI